MTESERKFIIGFGGVLAFWTVAQLPAVEGAFLEFLAVGKVPGTQIVLSPDAVIKMLPWFFALSLLLVFRKELRRSVRPRERTNKLAPAFKINSQSRQAEPAIVIRHIKTVRRKQTAAPKLALAGKRLPLLYIPSLRPYAVRLHTWTRASASLMWYICRRVCTLATRWAAIHAEAAWRIMEPYLRQFDRWLDKELHKNRYTGEALEIIEGCWRAIKSQWRSRRLRRS